MVTTNLKALLESLGLSGQDRSTPAPTKKNPKQFGLFGDDEPDYSNYGSARVADFDNPNPTPAVGIAQSLDEMRYDPNRTILAGAAATGPIGGATAGSSALKLAPAVTQQAGNALKLAEPLTNAAKGAIGPIAGALGVAGDVIGDQLSDALFSGTNSAPSTPPTNPFGLTGPSTIQAGLDALNAKRVTPPVANQPSTPSFTQAREGGSPAPTAPQGNVVNLFPTPEPPVQTATASPAPPPPLFTQAREGGTPAPSVSTDTPPPPSFVEAREGGAPAPPVGNTIATDNPWYIAPEELAQAMSATTAPTAQANTGGAGEGFLDIPQEFTPTATPTPPPPPTTPEPAPTPAPTTTPPAPPAPSAPTATPTVTPPPPVTPDASASTGTGSPSGSPTTGAGTSTGTGVGTGTGGTTPPPIPPPPTTTPVPVITPPPPTTTSPPINNGTDWDNRPPGNQGAVQNNIPTPPPIPAVSANQVSTTPFTPPPPVNAVSTRTDLPTAPTAARINLDNALTQPTFLPTLPQNTDSPNLNDILGGLPQSTLPTLPTNQVGNFQEYLGANATGQMSKEEIAAQARRMAEMQINPELAQAEQDRLAAQQRFALARSQVGLGQEEALADLDRGFDKNLRAIQAMAIRNGLTSSNIPMENDIDPLMRDYTMQRRTLAQGIQNQIAQLELEASLGDQGAGRRIQTLLGQLGRIESGANFDLSRDERNFGEQARTNRFGEFMGNEGLQRQQAQDQFGNQSDLFGLNEALRGNRMNETLAQAGLDRQARQDQFSNEATYGDMARGLRQDSLAEILAQAGFNRDSGQQDFANQMARSGMTEQQRQSDIGNNRADRSQSFGEWQGTQGMGLDLARLNEALAQGGIDRALSQDELNNRGIDNLLRQNLVRSQTAQNNASAQNGGMSVSERISMSEPIAGKIFGAQAIVRDSRSTAEERAEAQRVINYQKAAYEAINGPGSFERDFGPDAVPNPAQPSWWSRAGSLSPYLPQTP